MKTVGDEEATCSFDDDNPAFPRGTIAPTGTHRVPFCFPREENDRTSREQRRLKNTMCSGPKLIPKEDNTILVGKDHQAEVGEFVEGKSRDESPDRDEPMWKPEDVEGEDNIRNVYWTIVWRQFNGQIPFEWALKNLWENGYNIPNSLETVDQYLNVVAQSFKPLAKVQLDKFKKLWKKKNTGNRDIQETAMRNYHIAEVQHFYHEYKRFQKPIPGMCNCEDPLVQDLEFQTRWACSNCTKDHRTHLLPSDNLCLLCIKYKEMTGESRPAQNIVFLDEELQMIQSSNWIEKEQGRRISKEEFEKIQRKERIERLMRNELTEEEKDMLEGTQISRKSNNPSVEDKVRIGEKLVELLEPTPLPLFQKCQCGRGENVPAVTDTNAEMNQENKEEQARIETVEPTSNENFTNAEVEVEKAVTVQAVPKKQKRILSSKFEENLKHLPMKRVKKPKLIHDAC